MTLEKMGNPVTDEADTEGGAAASRTPAAVIEAHRVGPLQGLLFVLTTLALICDGLDIQLLNVAAPVILKEWSIPPSVLAPAIAAAVIGMAVGAGAGGMLGDRFGRRAVLIGALLLFGSITIAIAFIHDVRALTVVRLIAGFGFGAALPNGIALVSEWMPVRFRTQIIGLLALGSPLGGMAGTLLAKGLIESHGWRSTFIVSGAGTLALCLLMVFLLPDSPAYLVRKGKVALAQGLFRKAFGSAPGVLIAEAAATQAGPAAGGDPPLLSMYNLRVNLGFWLAHFACSCGGFLFQAWLTVMLTSVGMPLQQAITTTFIFLFAAMTGAIVFTNLMARFGTRWVPLSMIAISMASLIGLSVLLQAYDPARSAWWPVALALFILGNGLGACQAVLYAWTSASYPVSQRASGLGLGLAAGRIGGVTAIIAGGMLLSLHANAILMTTTSVLAALAAAAVGIAMVNRHAPPAARASQAAKAGAAV